MKNKVKSKSVSKLKNILRTNRTDQFKLKQIFSSLSLSEIRNSTRELLKESFFINHVKLNKSSKPADIYDYVIPETSLDKSVYWAMGVFINNVEKIEGFIILEKEITDNLHNGNVRKALELLDKIDELCGISIWSISLRSSILIENNEFSKLNDFVENILKNVEQFSLFSVIVKSVINKNDANDSIQENRSRIERQLRTTFYEDTEDLYYFLKYKLISFNPADEYDFKHIINIEKNSTLVDLFICCCDFAIHSIVSNKYDELNRELMVVVGRYFPNSIFYRLSDMYIKRDSCTVDSFSVNLIDNYSKGNYSYCYNSVMNADCSISFSHIEIAAKSACRMELVKDESKKGALISLLRSFLLKESDYHSSQNELYRLQNKYRDLQFYKNLIVFIELSEIRLNNVVKESLKKILFITSSFDSPFRAEFIHQENVSNFLEEINSVGYRETKAIWDLYKGEISLCDDSLSNVKYDRKLAYHCKYEMNYGNHVSGVDKLLDLVMLDDKLISFEASNILLSFYADSDMHYEAIELYNKLVLENRNYIYILANDKASRSAEAILKSDLNIKAFITLSLISRYIDSSISSKLRAAFNSLMRSRRCTDPLKLDLEGEWDRSEYIYFLKYICTTKIMKFFRHFKSPTDIEKARINICYYLITVEKNRDSIESELKELTKKIVLREATIQVAQSKVDADISLLRSGENVAHISSYERYLGLLNEDFNDFTKSLNVYELAGLLQENQLGVAYLTRSKRFEEATAIFIKLVRTVIEEFAFGEKGLNANVSTRIRHGHLPNTIRRSLLAEKLITSVSEQTKVVKSNDFWLDKLKDEADLESINKSLNNFTTLVNNIIHTINEEILQVSTLDENLSKLSKAEKPLFLYKPTDSKITLLQKKIDLSTSYTDFINLIDLWLWEITHTNLDFIREYITKHVSDHTYVFSELTS